MFDKEFARLAPGQLVDAIEQAERDEARAAARKAAAIAALVHATVTYDEVRDYYVYDSWAGCAGVVGAALSMSTRRASGQMRIAVALRERLPKVAALFAQGRLAPRLISEITWRTSLITDDRVLSEVDSDIAEKATRWGPLWDERLGNAVDAVIDRYDPDAVRRAREVVKTRDMHIGAAEDPNEIVAIWGHVMAGDAAVFKARVTAMVDGLCAEDPRSAGVRRSDAAGAYLRGETVLACRCGSPTCPAPTAAPVSPIVISVLADPAAVAAALALIAAEDREQERLHATRQGRQPQDVEGSGDEQEGPAEDIAPQGVDGLEVREQPAPEEEAEPEEEAPEPAPPADSGVALLPGAAIMPTPALAEALRGGARVKPLWMPGPEAEPQYRPSAKLAAFVRARDLFCRFPGCDVAAERCDIDHVVPWPYGPTHPSNLSCKCRTHHLAKTFVDGWRDTQLPDGTLIWTTPTGHTYTIVPGSRLFFPAWDITTAALPPPAQPPPAECREKRMPTRSRTRAADVAARINAERDRNAARRALEQHRATEAAAVEKSRRQGKSPPSNGVDPPPF